MCQVSLWMMSFKGRSCGLGLHGVLYSILDGTLWQKYMLELARTILTRHSGAKCTHKGREPGLSHVDETQVRKPTVLGGGG